MSAHYYSITDGARILKGMAPWSFLLDVAFRVFFLYLLIIVSMRLLGKRMGPQLTRNEMAALVSLAAAVGIPMQSSTRGLLPALVVAGVIVGLARLIAWVSTRSQKFERLTMDDIDIMVKDGRLQMKALRDTAISRELVMAQVRSYGIDHLGKVHRLYLESSGIFTLQITDSPPPGLSLFPKHDREMIERQQRAVDCFACETCGKLAKGPRPTGPCGECKRREWTEAVTSA